MEVGGKDKYKLSHFNKQSDIIILTKPVISNINSWEEIIIDFGWNEEYPYGWNEEYPYILVWYNKSDQTH